MEGHISKWGEVKSRKSKKEHSMTVAGPAVRVDVSGRNSDRTRGSRRENRNDNTSTWTTENVIGDWSTDITAQGGSWSAENPAENAKSSWASDSIDKAQEIIGTLNTLKIIGGVENDSWAADNPKDNWGSDDFGVDTTKNAPTKSPVSNSLRTIPPKPKASWAQIVKPESKTRTET
ncbi:unnamed protein product [Rhizophagus irregularis]|nr:unnamed protein product [Rhizophagus irregularis]